MEVEEVVDEEEIALF
jgi:oxysterol-binding protein 1